MLTAVQGLVALAESIPPTVDPAAVRRLMPAMEVVAERADKLALPAAVTLPLTRALEDMVLDSSVEVSAAGFAVVAQAARAVEVGGAVNGGAARNAWLAAPLGASSLEVCGDLRSDRPDQQRLAAASRRGAPRSSPCSRARTRRSARSRR